ncbi:MAG TPA: RNA polymerase sigma factor [Polyangiaceae bacterium]|nr:RNA polymerase sigma factor [Polyangiaceae bacterium]
MTTSLDFSRAYARFLPPIQAKCRRLLGCSSAAEDVAQEAFLRLWKSGVGEGSDTRTVIAWLYRTSTRLAIDVLRNGGKLEAPKVAVEDLPCAIDLAACAEARAAIVSVARSVPEEELAAVILCRVDCLSRPEAATVLRVSERTVRRMLARFDERITLLRKEFSS